MAASTPNKKPGLSLIEDELWYAGAISERKAEQILGKIGDKGVFLVRDSLLPDADYVLSVNGGSDIDHYNVKIASSNECVLNNYTFITLPDAIGFYTENRLGRVYLNKPEEPVVADPVSLKGAGPKIGFAPVSPVHQQVPTTDKAESPTENKATPSSEDVSKLQNGHKEEPASETQGQQSEGDIADNNEGDVTQQSNKPEDSAGIEEPTEGKNEDTPDLLPPKDTSEPTSKEGTTETPEQNTTETLQSEQEVAQSPPEPNLQLEESSPKLVVQPEEDTAQLSPEPIVEEDSTGQPSEEETNEDTPMSSSPKKSKTLPQEEAEVDVVDPAGSSPELLQLSHDDTPYNNVASDCSSGIATQENKSSSSIPEVSSSSQTDLEQGKSETDMKKNQSEELKQLPSISDKRKALEQRLSNNEEEKVVKKAKAKVPPPVPRRTTFTDLSKTQSTEAKKEEQGEPIPRRDDIVKFSIKNTPPPAPKRLSIPHSFQNKDDDDMQQKPTTEPPKRLSIPHSFQQTTEETDGPPENPTEQRTPRRLSIPQNFQKTEEEEKEVTTSPTGPPKRLVIPQSLQVQPPPPPLATHPFLAKKEEERQQQAEAEKMDKLQPQPQPQKSKKRRSLFGRKSKDSDKEKDKSGVKRKPSFKAEEPIPLEQAESQKQKQEERPAEPSPPRPKKVIGVPTLAVSPVSLDASGGGAELESVFRIITKHDWHPEDSEVKKEIVHSTFGQHAIKLADPPVGKAGDKPNTSEETKTKKESVGNIVVSTFKPKEPSTSSLGDKDASFDSLDSPLSAGNTFNVSPSVAPKSPSQELVSSPTPLIGFIARPGSALVKTNSVTSLHSSGSSTPSTPKTPINKEHTTSPHTPPARKTSPSPASPTHLASISQTAKASPQPSPKHSKESTKSQSTGVLPSNSPAKSVSTGHSFGHHHSLADVVPGIPKKTASTLPRGLPSMEENDVDSPSGALPGVCVSSVSARERINTAPSKTKPEQGPMNTKRTDKAAIKKRGSIFKKK